MTVQIGNASVSFRDWAKHDLFPQGYAGQLAPVSVTKQYRDHLTLSVNPAFVFADLIVQANVAGPVAHLNVVIGSSVVKSGDDDGLRASPLVLTIKTTDAREIATLEEFLHGVMQAIEKEVK